MHAGRILQNTECVCVCAQQCVSGHSLHILELLVEDLTCLNQRYAYVNMLFWGKMTF